jgi:catechol 2,3-dioxygenase-like lactoylglutathione lyase family enzyme
MAHVAHQTRLGLITLVVDDYDQAIDYYTRRLGFELREDSPHADGNGKRWVVVAPPGCGENGTALLLARAVTGHQRSRVGDQTGGRVGFFLYTDDFDASYRRLTEAGVTIEKPPWHEPYGTVAVFADLYGNRWDLIQPSAPSA